MMMLTRKLMKRGSGFKQPERPEKIPALLRPIRQDVSIGQSATLPVEEMPKFVYYRSDALLKACREIPCQACGIQDGTVVAAHSNQIRHGKCRGKKASDQFVASLCFTCHSGLDQGCKMSREERNLMWYLAHLKTVTSLTKAGLWPDDIPVPQENYDYD